jgi:hypothetical protein
MGFKSPFRTGEERHKMLIGDYLKAQDDGKSALMEPPETG